MLLSAHPFTLLQPSTTEREREGGRTSKGEGGNLNNNGQSGEKEMEENGKKRWKICVLLKRPVSQAASAPLLLSSIALQKALPTGC